MLKRKKGFTLIEVLLVISIISLFSSVTFSYVKDTRSKARDARRIQDLIQIRNALELFYLDNGRYPFGDDKGLRLTLSPPTRGFPGEDWKYLEEDLKKYIYPLPRDPINMDVKAGSGWKKGSYFYTYWNYDHVKNKGGSYSIFASLENPLSDKNYIDKKTTRCNWLPADCMYNVMNGGFGFINK